MTLQEFYDCLSRLDWNYEYCDNYGQWSKGRQEMQEMEEVAKTSPRHAALFKQYKEYVSGKREKQPRRPPAEDGRIGGGQYVGDF